MTKYYLKCLRWSLINRVLFIFGAPGADVEVSLAGIGLFYYHCHCLELPKHRDDKMQTYF